MIGSVAIVGILAVGGCSKMNSNTLSRIVPESYSYTVVKENSSRAFLFGDPDSFYVVEFRGNIFSSPNRIFDGKKFDLADLADRQYFVNKVLPKYGEEVGGGSSLFRADICSNNFSKRCEGNSNAYSVYLLVEKSGKKAFILVVSL